MILTVTQKVAAKVEFDDSKGNAAPVDGATTWVSSDETVATVQAGKTIDASGATVDAADDKSAVIVATGKPGSAQISASADAALDASVRTLAATLQVDVHPNEAVSANISAGTPVEQ